MCSKILFFVSILHQLVEVEKVNPKYFWRLARCEFFNVKTWRSCACRGIREMMYVELEMQALMCGFASAMLFFYVGISIYLHPKLPTLTILFYWKNRTLYLIRMMFSFKMMLAFVTVSLIPLERKSQMLGAWLFANTQMDRYFNMLPLRWTCYHCVEHSFSFPEECTNLTVSKRRSCQPPRVQTLKSIGRTIATTSSWIELFSSARTIFYRFMLT
jgi:hypothetical protein